MRKIFLYILLILGICSITAKVKTRFFIGEKEVSENFYNNIPDSIRNKSILGTFDYDTLLVKTMDLPYTHYIDTISQPGTLLIKKNTPQRIAFIEKTIFFNKQKSIKLQVGDTLFDSISNLNIENDTLNTIFANSEKCYYISFWATWCGNCLIELQPDNIPEWISQFNNNPDFEFLPICIDTTPLELNHFFDSEKGKKWKYLYDLTLIDIERKTNSIFAESGILPLNIVIGKGGIIRYIKIGRIDGIDQINELIEAIRIGLQS